MHRRRWYQIRVILRRRFSDFLRWWTRSLKHRRHKGWHYAARHAASGSWPVTALVSFFRRRFSYLLILLMGVGGLWAGIKNTPPGWLTEGLVWGREVVVPATISYWQGEDNFPQETLRQGLPSLGGPRPGLGKLTGRLLYYLTSYDFQEPKTFFRAQLPALKEEELLTEMSLEEGEVPLPVPGTPVPPATGPVTTADPAASPQIPVVTQKPTPTVNTVAPSSGPGLSIPEGASQKWGNTPLIAIYHTHSSETYHGPSVHSPNVSSYSGDYTWGQTGGMISIGDELARTLAEKYGIPVVHSRQSHDYPVFRQAYINSRKTLSTILNRYPGVVLSLDVHRDGMGSPTDETITTMVGGERMARIAIIVGKGRAGLPNPHWQKNNALARELERQMNRLYPGLCRGVIVKEWPYNQDLSENNILLEIGDHHNTKAEALRSAQLLADVLAEMLPDLVNRNTPPALRHTRR